MISFTFGHNILSYDEMTDDGCLVLGIDQWFRLVNLLTSMLPHSRFVSS